MCRSFNYRLNASSDARSAGAGVFYLSRNPQAPVRPAALPPLFSFAKGRHLPDPAAAKGISKAATTICFATPGSYASPPFFLLM